GSAGPPRRGAAGTGPGGLTHQSPSVISGMPPYHDGHMFFPMVRKIDWDNQIGRRLRLRDLHVFFTVVQRGSMAKAAAHLGVSQPAVSEVIGNLEHALGVRLLDRSPQGIEPTMYGRALIKRG